MRWWVQVDAAELDDDGFLRDVAPLKHARDYVVPRRFEIELSTEAGGMLTLSVAVNELGDAEVSAYTVHRPTVGAPAPPLAKLLPHALAHAAVPRTWPSADEFSMHGPELLGGMTPRRARRVPDEQWWLIRECLEEAEADPDISSEHEIREYVFRWLVDRFPDDWKPRDGRSVDSDRLRPYVAQLRAERELLALIAAVERDPAAAAPISLRPGSYSLPDGWEVSPIEYLDDREAEIRANLGLD